MWIARLPLGLALLIVLSCGRGNEAPQPTRTLPVADHPTAAVSSSELARIAETPTRIAEAPMSDAAPPEPASAQCLPQAAQKFLIEAHLRAQNLTSAKAQSDWWAALQRSIRYRTEQYGYYAGFGARAWNPRPLASQMRAVRFMGLPVVLHERILPALRCVELAILRDCPEPTYRPRTCAGVRQSNTYFGGDVSNHVYGIALDIDPSDNPCCNCVEPWRNNPRCRGNKTDWERMAMPRCWVTAFEEYGFYWLGHDELKDTMHFEFLGDPNKISVTDPP